MNMTTFYDRDRESKYLEIKTCIVLNVENSIDSLPSDNEAEECKTN